jgi:hypothetical protein
MSEEVRLWQVEHDNLKEIGRTKLNLEERIENWIRQDITVLAPDLLVIGQQVPTAYDKFIDLLCMDASGGLVIIELKRAKTPRDVTAQGLDYASWVKTLDADSIETIAAGHFKGVETLESAFRKKFNDDLPDILNEHHSIIIVASEIDDGTERIIRYLSDAGIGINAARFEFYKGEDGREFLSRSFTLAPEEAEKAIAKGSSKRTIPSLAEMEHRADDTGIGKLYRECVAALVPCFESYGTNKTAIWFAGTGEGGATKRIIVSIVPGKSSKDTGLRYQVYRNRLASYVHKSADTVLEHLPPNPEEYVYYPTAPDDLKGWAGYIKTSEDITRMASLFAEQQAAFATSS